MTCLDKNRFFGYNEGRNRRERKCMNDPHSQNEKKPPSRGLLLLFVGVLAGVILTLAIVGAIVLISRRTVSPPDLPSDVEILSEDPEKTPLFDGNVTLPPLDRDGAKTPDLGAEVAVLLDVSSGKVLASKGGQNKFFPASITKIMTMVVACERLSLEDLDEKATMTEEVYNYVREGGYKDSSVFAFYPGEEIKIRDLLFGVGVKSCSDCTLLLIRKLAASEEEFVGWMNAKAKALGMNATHFDNVIGYESEDNYSTAEDLAILLTYALECDLIREILSSPSYTFYYGAYMKSGEWKDDIRGTFFSTLFNANGTGRIADYEKEIGKKFSLAAGTLDGGKTGSLKFGSNWAYSLASYATIGGKVYVSIVGNSSSSAGLMKDVKALFDGYAK